MCVAADSCRHEWVENFVAHRVARSLAVLSVFYISYPAYVFLEPYTIEHPVQSETNNDNNNS